MFSAVGISDYRDVLIAEMSSYLIFSILTNLATSRFFEETFQV